MKINLKKYCNQQQINHHNSKKNKRGDEVLKGKNRYELIKDYNNKGMALLHPCWDSFFLFQIENEAKTKPEIAEAFFTNIEKTTVSDFIEWFYFDTDFFQNFYVNNCRKYAELTIYSETYNGRSLSILEENYKIKQVFEGIYIVTWDIPDDIFVNDIAKCYTINENFEKQFGLVNPQGEFILKPQFEEIGYSVLNNTFVRFMDKGKFGFLSFDGQIKIPAIYDSVYGDDIGDNNWNFLECKIGKNAGLLDYSLKEILPFKFSRIAVFNEEFSEKLEDIVFWAYTFENTIEKYHFVNEKLSLI
ncbi:MAG: hypothetical protein A2046_07320 [Bacteroidetes bacterium GWA2_30_7]|nr:MAG: hypothetical protein A2046_07320 [Bacteroidetes bacterium GWA2_30_7]